MIALILAGGKGSRLEPWHAPKCLMPVNGVPILHRIIKHLEQFVDKVVVCAGYRSADVRASLFGTTVAVSDAGENAGMIERIQVAMKEFSLSGLCIVCYGDEWAPVRIDELLSLHRQARVSLTITAYEQPFGLGIVLRNGVMLDRIDDSERVLVNIGYMVFDVSLVNGEKGYRGLSEFASRNRNAACYIHVGERFTINTLKELSDAERKLSEAGAVERKELLG